MGTFNMLTLGYVITCQPSRHFQHAYSQATFQHINHIGSFNMFNPRLRYDMSTIKALSTCLNPGYVITCQPSRPFQHA